MKPKKHNTQNDLSEKQFKALIENAHEGIVLYDQTANIKYASPAVQRLCGLKENKVLGMNGADFIHPDDLERTRKVFRALVEKPGKSVTLSKRVRHSKGHYIWMEARLTNFLHVPEINGIVSNFKDLTERKQAEEKAKKTQDFLETINRNLSEGIFMGILGKKFLYVNDAFLTITGYKYQEIQKIKPSALYVDRKQRDKLARDIRKDHTLKGVEVLFRKKNGEPVLVSLSASLLKHEGKEDYFVGTLRDITKEKEAERERIESRNFLNNIINTVAAPIFVKDAKHRWVMFNEKFMELLGKSREQLLGKTDTDFFMPDEVRVFRNIDNQVLRTGKTIENEEKITTPSGVHTLLTVKSRYVDEKGNKFIIAFITDVTHLKKAEEKIKNLHADLKGILESSQESIFAIDKNLCYTAFNQHHKNTMKLLYGAHIAIGNNKLQYLKKFSDHKWVKAELLKALEGDHFATQHYQDFPVYKGYIQTTYNPIRDEKNQIKGVAVFVRDITERKRFEEIIKSVNANLRAVMESTADRILAVDKNYRYITFNQSHALSAKELLGKEIKVGDNVLEGLSPELSAISQRDNAQAFRGKQFTVETKLSDGNFLETSYNPIYDEKGNITGNALFIRDTTERKRMEERLKLLNEELTHQNAQLALQEEELKAALEELSERNFELDQLMYKTSHDLRSPLSSIMGLINLAHLDDDPANHKTYLDR
jgi:PAS domain S-box-containing protein